MDKWLTRKNLKAGILGQIGDGLRTPAKKVVVDIPWAKLDPNSFAGDHQNQQAPWSKFVQKLAKDEKGILHMFQGIVGNRPVKRFLGNLGEIGNGGNPKGFRCAASLRVDFHAKLSMAREIGQKPAAATPKIQDIQIRGEPFFKFDTVGPASKLPDGGVPVKICF